MKINKIISVFAFFLILAVSSNMLAQEGQQKKMSPEQKAWMEYMMPGPMQKMLEKHVGKWKTVNKYWQYPGAEPMVSEGTAEYTMILGGRYLKGTFSGIMMNQPFKGMSLDAYDNAMGKFKSIWIDNMGTGIASSEGTYDKTNNEINFMGSMVDPVQKKEMPFRSKVKFVDSNTEVFNMYMMHKGKEFKGMEITYTRVK